MRPQKEKKKCERYLIALTVHSPILLSCCRGEDEFGYTNNPTDLMLICENYKFGDYLLPNMLYRIENFRP